MNKIDVWTIQDPGAISFANKNGFLTGNETHSFPEQVAKWLGHENENLRRAYRWMIDQMRRRIPSFTGDWPLWAYTSRPDLRGKRYMTLDHPTGFLVLIHATVPASRVLLHNADLWYLVMSAAPITKTETEDDLLSEQPLEKVKETWDRLFDLEFEKNADPKWVGEGPFEIHATVDRIYLDEIQSAKTFRVRTLSKK